MVIEILARPHQLQDRNIGILSITPVEGHGALLAFVNIRLGALVFNDCRIFRETGKRAWFSFPALSYKNQYDTTNYRTFVQVLDEHLKNQISEAVLSTWGNSIGGSNGEHTK